MPVPATLAGHDLPTARNLKRRAFGTVLELQGRSPWRPAGPTLSRIGGLARERPKASAGARWVNSHNFISMLSTYEARLLAIMRPQMFMHFHARGQMKAFAKQGK